MANQRVRNASRLAQPTVAAATSSLGVPIVAPTRWRTRAGRWCNVEPVRCSCRPRAARGTFVCLRLRRCVRCAILEREETRGGAGGGGDIRRVQRHQPRGSSVIHGYMFSVCENHPARGRARIPTLFGTKAAPELWGWAGTGSGGKTRFVYMRLFLHMKFVSSLRFFPARSLLSP